MCTNWEQTRGPRNRKEGGFEEELRKIKKKPIQSYFTPEPKPGTSFSDTITQDEVAGPKKTPEKQTYELCTHPDPKLKTLLPSCEGQNKVIETTSLKLENNKKSE